MVLHVLKRDPVLRDLKHVQVDGPDTAYLFFYDKQGHKGLKQEVTENLWTHVAKHSLNGFHVLLILWLFSCPWRRDGNELQLH